MKQGSEQEQYEGSPELDVDLELLSVYEKRLERAIRCAFATCPIWLQAVSKAHRFLWTIWPW